MSSMDLSAKLQIKPGQRVATITACRGGMQPVRQIAIDGVWSALRFRPA
jgi:hypothetical protein